MKRLLFLFLFITSLCLGQSSITDKLTSSIKTGGAGVAYFVISYGAGTYKTQETDVISTNAADTNNIVFSVRIAINDTGTSKLDSTFTLTSSQVSLLNSFYQAASGGSNPDPNISNAKTGASGALTVSLCCGDNTDMTYSTTMHISLGRYLLSYWTNWN